MLSTKYRLSAFGMAAVALIALAVAGCGGGDSSTNSEPSSAGDTNEVTTAENQSSDLVAEATAKVAEYEKGGEFPPLQAPYSPGKGKVAIIACALAGPDCKHAAEAAEDAASAMGWESQVFDAEFSPQKGAAFIDQAVQQGYDGVVSIAIPIATMKQSVDSALAKGVVIDCAACLIQPGFDEVDFQSVDWESQGEELASYVIADTNGEAKMLVYDDPGQPAVALRIDGFKKTMEACPDCEGDYTDIAETEIGKPGPPQFLGELAKYPEGSLNTVVDPYDALGVPMAKTLAQQGRTDVTVDGYDANLEGLEGMVSGDLPMGGTEGLPYTYMAWSGVDAVARAKAGAPEYDATNLPTILITKSNAQQFIGKYYAPANFEKEFEASWE